MINKLFKYIADSLKNGWQAMIDYWKELDALYKAYTIVFLLIVLTIIIFTV